MKREIPPIKQWAELVIKVKKMELKDDKNAPSNCGHECIENFQKKK
jgi:hypothetical protein